MSDFTHLKAQYENFVIPTYGRFDLSIAKGAGCRVWDIDGREYLDFGAGIAVCSLGHAHPEITEAIASQASQLVHSSNLYYTLPQGDLAEKLASLMGVDGRVFFCNSGAEANEGLIKTARRFGSQTGGRFKILTFQNSFHGRTMAGISATGQDKVKTGFAPLLPGFVHLPFGDLDSVKAAIDSETAAILVEPVQGEGGIHVGTAAFLQGLRSLCDENNLLLLFDEVQCGLGRTGDWCGWRSMTGSTVDPDGVSWAKGIANGFPLGAFWIRKKTFAGAGDLSLLLGPGSHGTTYGGNPVCCAAALKVLEIIERDFLLTNALEAGAFLREEIRSFESQMVREVRALGLMIGIELSDAVQPPPGVTPALHLTKLLMAEGLLVIPAGERVLRLLPPLNVSRGELVEATSLLRKSLASLPQS